MSNPLASTTFSAGPKDTLATADIYKASSRAIVNSIQEISSKLGTDVPGLIKSLRSSDFGKLFTKVDGKLKVNKEVLTLRMLGANNAVSNAFRNLDTTTKEAIVKSFEDSGKLSVKINNVISSVDSADFTKIDSLGKFVNEKTKSTFYEPDDGDAVSTLLAGIIVEGSALGVNGLYDNLTPGLSPGTLAKVINKSLPGVTKNGDLKSLSSIANSVLGKQLDYIYPDFANDLAKAFGKKRLVDVLDPHADYHMALSILSATNEDWDVFVRENGWPSDEGYSVDTGMNIVKIQNASPQFQEMILTGIKSEADHDRRKNYALIQFYRRTTVDDAIMRHFPKVVLSTPLYPSLNNTVHKNKTVDPRALSKIGVKIGTRILDSLL